MFMIGNVLKLLVYISCSAAVTGLMVAILQASAWSYPVLSSTTMPSAAIVPTVIPVAMQNGMAWVVSGLPDVDIVNITTMNGTLY